MKRCKWLAVLLLALLMALQPMSVCALTYSGSASYASGKYYTALTAVTLTGNQRTDIVNIARSQIGYQEGGSSSELSGEVKGGNNYTEYGKWYGLQDMWCAMFVSWCAYVAGVPTSVVPKHSFTVEGLNKFIANGRAYTRAQVASGTYTPKGGDIIYFKSSRNTNKTNHVGIVTSYSGTTVYTIEGNTSSATISTNGGAVCSKSYDISNTYIVYICNPNYSSDSGTSTPTPGGVCYPACDYSYSSLADALRSIGVDGSYAYRKVIAAANKIEGYEGLPEQNEYMLTLLKEGKLINPEGVPETPQEPENPVIPYYYPACDASYQTIIPALDSIGVTSTYAYRKVIAAANNMEGYEGTPEQNNYMLSLLKEGKLINPEGTPPEEEKDIFFPACDASFTTIALALDSIGVDSSLDYRKKIAAANNIEDYKGTVDQNAQMLSLLKAGELRMPQEESPEPEPPKTFPPCADSFTSIASALSSIGVDSSLDYRKKIAAANNIADYKGTAEQNTQMLQLLKSGQLLIPTEVETTGFCSCSIAYVEHIILAESCTENGAEYDRCSRCGAESERKILQAAGHAYNAVTTEATCTKDGNITYTCPCGDSYSETLHAPGHNFDDTISENVQTIPPTVHKEGKKIVRCTRCTETDETTLPCIPHLAGDVNDDGLVNLKDVVLTTRYLAGWEIQILSENADVDADGEVTLLDVTLMRRFIAGGYDITLL